MTDPSRLSGAADANSRAPRARLSSGSSELDNVLGGGFLPGTLTVVVGATGIGKTQLGVQFAQGGAAGERRRGAIFDMSARLDSQSHAEYARRMFAWELTAASTEQPASAEPLVEFQKLFAPGFEPGDYLHVFDHRGRVAPAHDQARHEWQVELAHKLSATVAFFYGNLVAGTRRFVIDGIEPAERASESVQMELFEYVYHQVFRKDSDWVARDLLRQHFRSLAPLVEQHAYDPRDAACLALYTSHETMLDQLIERPIQDGDLLANANTLIYMGKTREGNRLGRGLYVAKHRGSALRDEIVPYTIDDRGLIL